MRFTPDTCHLEHSDVCKRGYPRKTGQLEDSHRDLKCRKARPRWLRIQKPEALMLQSVPPYVDTRKRFLQGVCQKKWVVYAKVPFGSAEHTLNYLGRYTHRVAISNHRLLDMQSDQVRFTCCNRQQGDR